MSYDPYGRDVLATDWRKSKTPPPVEHEARADLVVEETATGWCGAVTGIEGKTVQLEDRHGKRRVFPLGPGFLLEGTPIVLVAPRKKAGAPARTASGSFAVADSRARVALPSRIYVEGRHDAELVEKVWGDDLRVEGVVVEYLGGIDDLGAIIADFAPTRTRRVGVLVDHLVPGSKESRIADAVMRGNHGGNVLVVGHPYVDVWQSVKPARVGLTVWPEIPRSIEWKKGICAALGLPNETQADIARAWQAILGRVRTYSDLEPAFLGRVEELIDFVTAP
ncbi:hypothetical protein IWX78_002636 [Mycetocola sp. CAN_C7]|uniref:DUF3097 domain-containing protein n=1 Tax=Mycetocola sp. CAN_C7 TaxID=2787724 RepID=UPI0018C9071C